MISDLTLNRSLWHCWWILQH